MSYKFLFQIEVEIELTVEEHVACIKHYQDNWRDEIDDGEMDEIPDATNLVEAWSQRSHNTIDEDHGFGITLKWSSIGDADEQ